MADTVVNWGILGCANIARKNIRAIQLSKDNQIIGIASRSLTTAVTFIKENNLDSEITKAYGSYDKLLNDSSIHAVYIPLPTTMHVEWAVKAANAKKHILLEKPTAVNLETLKTILSACEANHVLFMDGVMFMHHNRLSLLRNILLDPFSGEVKRINSSFSFHSNEEFLTSNIRCQASQDPLGALGDLGWYNIRLGIIAFAHGYDFEAYGSSDAKVKAKSVAMYPMKCSAKCNVWNTEGVPLDIEATVWFGNLKQGTDTLESITMDAEEEIRYLRFDASFLQPFRQTFEISLSSHVKGVGDKVITCKDFVICRSNSGGKLVVETQQQGGPIINQATVVSSLEEEMKSQPCCQEAEMFTTFGSYIQARYGSKINTTLPSEKYWTEMSLWTQATVDACLLSMQSGTVVSIQI